MFELNTRILVVDDMSVMRKIVGKAVKEIGFKDLVEAADGQIAWEALQSASPAIGLIISDWNMPNCTGIDLLKRVRADSRFKMVPFVLLTAESEGKQVAEAVKSGVDNYIVKPFTAEVLKVKLEETHKRSSARLAAKAG
jgi:two-component system chemotaxis response regulator CheY